MRSARLLVQGEVGKVGRVCVLHQARGVGIGVALIRAAVARLRGIEGGKNAKLGAQVHALWFYEALGFEAFGPVYDVPGLLIEIWCW